MEKGKGIISILRSRSNVIVALNMDNDQQFDEPKIQDNALRACINEDNR
jgi:hypothetical protein